MLLERINVTHVWAFQNCCVCLVIIMRECFRNLNQTLQLEYTKLGLKEKLSGGRMSITGTQKFQSPCRKAKLQTSRTASLQSEWKKPINPLAGGATHFRNEQP